MCIRDSTDTELAEIRALHYEMLAAYTRRDLPTYYRINAQIHARINAAAGNRVLTQTWGTVNARLQALRFRSNFDEAKWKRAVKEHEKMVELLAARDGAASSSTILSCSFTARFHFAPSKFDRKRSACSRALTVAQVCVSTRLPAAALIRAWICALIR